LSIWISVSVSVTVMGLAASAARAARAAVGVKGATALAAAMVLNSRRVTMTVAPFRVPGRAIEEYRSISNLLPLVS
jgi:hypothetical protein